MPSVLIHNDWSYPDIMRQTPSGSGCWEDFVFTKGSSGVADALIVCNRPTTFLWGKVNAGARWLYMQEPPVQCFNDDLKSYKYFDRIYSFWPNGVHSHQYCLQTSLPWHVDKNYDELLSLSVKKEDKSDGISWVTSNASARPGHKLRMHFLDYLKKVHFPLKLYGRGFQFIDDKFDALYPYKYSLAIENYSTPHYWTEKLSDCFLSWCMPIYWGDPSITDYFPERAMILIDPANPKAALQKIETAISENSWEANLDAIAEARELVLNKYQFFPSAVERLRKLEMFPKKKFFFIPPNLSVTFQKSKQCVRAMLKR